jgi:hypothetical protein
VVELIIGIAGTGTAAIAAAVAKVRVARYRHQSLVTLAAKAHPKDIPEVAKWAFLQRQLGPWRQPPANQTDVPQTGDVGGTVSGLSESPPPEGE